jgi:hypothetical protein
MKPLTLVAIATLFAAAPAMAQQPTTKPKADSAHAGMKGMKHDMNGMKGMNHDDPDHAVQGGGTLPEGWSARTDRDAPLTNVKFVSMGDGFHATTGPAAILYRESNKVSGPFHAVASFTQTKAPTHPEAYGLFFGGKALNGEGQQYTYFLVRGVGKFLVKQRNGAETKNLSEGWTANPAVNSQDAAGKATNKLEIDATTPGKVKFLANGTSVYEMDASAADINGIVGLRINHNLDVHVAGFGVHPR